MQNSNTPRSHFQKGQQPTELNFWKQQPPTGLHFYKTAPPTGFEYNQPPLSPNNFAGTALRVLMAYLQNQWITYEPQHQKMYLRTCEPSHYENTPIQTYWKIYHQKKWKFSDKNSDIFYISAQNIDCGYSLELPRRGGSNKYPQSIFLSRNKKNNVYPCKPQFYYIKVGFKGVKITQACFRDGKFSSACTFLQSDQKLHCVHFG